MATAKTHTVVKGDTLSEIAVRYGTTVKALMELNPDIKDADLIYIGQVITYSGSATTATTTTTYRATITAFGLQSNSDNLLFATWAWDKGNTASYQIRWKYQTKDGSWFYGSNTSISVNKNDPDSSKQSTYSIPSNATNVSFEVKPVSETKSGSSDTTYWTAEWSTKKTYDVSNNPPKVPSSPTVNIEKYQLKAELSNLDVNGTHIEFQVVKNNTIVFNTGTATINTTTNYASYSCKVDAGGLYKVRCRSRKGNSYSDWSNYSSNVGAIPSAPSEITDYRATSKTSVYLEWNTVPSAESYDIEYTTKSSYFDTTNQTTIVSAGEANHWELTELTTGEKYFFRVRAVNDHGQSEWSDIVSITIGTDPVAPTTWSSTTTVISGEPLTLYWVHNSEDGSSETYADLDVYIDGVDLMIPQIKKSEEEDEKDKTSFYIIDTSEYSDGAVVKWRVRTAGVTLNYGEWSIQRTVNIYAPPTLALNVTNSAGDSVVLLESFPIYISAVAGPETQKPIGYHLAIASNDIYETVDNAGNTHIVNANDEVYSKQFDISTALSLELSAGDMDLENNISYTVTCTAFMDSGLDVTQTFIFTVAWTDLQYWPNAEIEIDKDTYSAYIRPHCEDNYGVPINDILLSVYRREFDGSFTELATGIENNGTTFVTDPHPALDYARYRVVATTKSTGAVSYYDIPGTLVGCKSIIIQWREEWSRFESSDDPLDQPPWSGSMLKLPYNIDISDSNRPDVALIEYVGRKYPVSYYGTQLGGSATWNVEIEKSDKETLYALRRLSIWAGDVYIREPSGSGYWANITVTFSQKHCEVTIPVTINITRVEGGV